MNIADILVGTVIAAIVAFAVRYIYKSKKKGIKCIGCPAAGRCGKVQGKDCSSCCCRNDRF